MQQSRLLLLPRSVQCYVTTSFLLREEGEEGGRGNALLQMARATARAGCGGGGEGEGYLNGCSSPSPRAAGTSGGGGDGGGCNGGGGGGGGAAGERRFKALYSSVPTAPGVGRVLRAPPFCYYRYYSPRIFFLQSDRRVI